MVSLAGATILGSLSPGDVGVAAAPGGEPFDAAGNVGATSYLTLPFVSQVYANCWGCSPELAPLELFLRPNSTAFGDPQRLRLTRESASGFEQRGVVPSGTAQRWQSTYAESFPPGTFTGEPAWVRGSNDKGFSTQPAFVAWRDFVAGHPQYWDTAFDGGTMPPEFRTWGGQWGHISPLTRLDPADCPPDLTACTWGDSFAYRWAGVARLTGAYGIQLSDFSDSQPHAPSTVQDFNPRITAAFAAATGIRVPPGGVAQQAAWIVAQAFNDWNDFFAAGYGRFFAALASRLGAAANRAGLVIDQCSFTPSQERLRGIDARLIARQMDPRNYLCMWDEHLIQGDRPGPIVRPPLQELAGAIINAAREPRIRNGANIEADNANYRKAVAKFYPTLSAAAQQEVGRALLKRLWLWFAWAHIADQDGAVRRALAFTGRDYWDDGDLRPLDPLTRLIQTIVPRRPFGPALYYPVSVERAIEQREGRAAGAGHLPATYLPLEALQPLLDAHGLGYYVSDAALPRLHRGDAAAPSAWVVLDAQGLLPEPERRALAAIAPVVTSAAQLAALPGQPLGFPPSMAGFGFYDQHDRLILVVSNPATAADALAVAGEVRLARLPPGRYVARDLFSGAAVPVAVDAGGSARLPVTLARWDTKVLALEPQAP